MPPLLKETKMEVEPTNNPPNQGTASSSTAAYTEQSRTDRPPHTGEDGKSREENYAARMEEERNTADEGRSGTDRSRLPGSTPVGQQGPQRAETPGPRSYAGQELRVNQPPRHEDYFFGMVSNRVPLPPNQACEVTLLHPRTHAKDGSYVLTQDSWRSPISLLATNPDEGIMEHAKVRLAEHHILGSEESVRFVSFPFVTLSFTQQEPRRQLRRFFTPHCHRFSCATTLRDSTTRRAALPPLNRDKSSSYKDHFFQQKKPVCGWERKR